jgi:DNA-binding NarL/FixJ family response regulator
MSYPIVIVIPKAHVQTFEDVELLSIEVQIMHWLACDCNIGKVADKLCLAYRTVHDRISNLYEKTGLTCHAGLVAFCFAHNILVIKEGKPHVNINIG